MTKLTEMINLKAAVSGAAVLTALSGFISQPAQAFFPFNGPSINDNSNVSFEINLETDPGLGGILPQNISNVVENFVFTNNFGTPDTMDDITVSFDGVDLFVSECCSPTTFFGVGDPKSNFVDDLIRDEIFSGSIPRNFLQYSVEFSNATVEGVSGVSNVSGLFTFVADRTKGILGVNDTPVGMPDGVPDGVIMFDSSALLNAIDVGDDLSDPNPILISLSADSIDRVSTPESSTLVSLLAFSALGAVWSLKGKLKQS